MEKVFIIKNVSFFNRFYIYIVGVIVFITFIIINLIKLRLDFLFISIFCFFIFFGFPFSELKKDLQHTILVSFNNETIYIKYYYIHKLTTETLNIKDCVIRIRSYAITRWNIEYYLEIKSKNKSYYINRKFNLDYNEVLEIFELFKNNKNEKIIYDEKYLLDLIRKKTVNNH